MSTRGVLAAICMAVVLHSPASVGIAEALPSRAATQAELDKLETQIARLDEEYNLARLELAKVAHEIRDLDAQKEKANLELQTLRHETSLRAVAIYRAGLPDVVMALFESKTLGEFGRRMGLISQVDNWEAKLIESLSIAQQRYSFLNEGLQRELSRRREVTSTLNSRRDLLESKVRQQQTLLQQIDAAATAAQRARRSAASQRVPVPTDLPVSGRARVAVEVAYDQIGKPYRWGASGPDSFDCSGLTMFSWGKAGVSLPHSSRAQYSATKRVARESLQPGDLVFFGRPIHHVGIYIGNGRMINAPESGERVGIRSMDRRDYAGAGRPGV